MKKNIVFICLFLFLSTCLAGCVTVGQPFPESKVKEIMVGKTTRVEIESIYGTPFRTGLDSGDLTATYVYYKFGLFSNAKTADLKVVYAKDNTVKSYTYSSNQSDDQADTEE